MHATLNLFLHKRNHSIMARSPLLTNFHAAVGIGTLCGAGKIFVHTKMHTAVTVRMGLDSFGKASISGLLYTAIGECNLPLARAQARHGVALENLKVSVIVADEFLQQRILFGQLQ